MFKGLMLLIVMGAMMVANAEVHTPRPEISVRNQVDVAEKKSVQLMDIATVDFVDESQAQAALALNLFDGPVDGKKLTFKNTELVRALKAKISENSDLSVLKWTFFVPEQVDVTAKKILISPLAAENQIQRAILAKCLDCKVNIRDLRIPNTRDMQGVNNCQVQTENIKVGGTFLVPVQCSAGTETRTYWISGTAKVSKLAPISTRQISPGDRIAAKDFRMGDVDMTYARDGVPNEHELVGQISNRLIMLNQAIYRNDLKKELAISRGQVIKTLMGDENFEITSQGVAEEQGYIGDSVRVKNSETQKTLSGIVIEKGVVRLQ